MPQYYSTTAAAKLCQASRGSVLRWVHEGRLKASVTPGGHHRIHASDLEEFLKQLGISAPADFREFIPVNKILIVEDDPDMCRFIKKALSKLPARIESQTANDGLQAGWYLSKSVPDLVILDLHLPKVDGFEVCKFLKSEPVFSKTKILAVSTYNAEKKERILKLGADCFLGKPFTFQAITQIIERLLGNGKTVFEKGEAA